MTSLLKLEKGETGECAMSNFSIRQKPCKFEVFSGEIFVLNGTLFSCLLRQILNYTQSNNKAVCQNLL